MSNIFKNKKLYTILLSFIVFVLILFSSGYFLYNKTSFKNDLLKIESYYLKNYSKKKFVKNALIRVEIYNKQELQKYVINNFDLFLNSNTNLYEFINNYANLYKDSFELLFDLKKSKAIYSNDYKEIKKYLNNFRFNEVLNKLSYLTLKNNSNDLIAKKKYFEGVIFELLFNYNMAKNAYSNAKNLNAYETRYYRSLGNIYYKLYDFKSAVDIYKEGLNISSLNDRKNSNEKLILLFNLAKTYTIIREDEKALRLYSNLLVNSIAYDDLKYQWLAIYNMAIIEASYGNYSISLNYLKYSLKLATKMRDKFYISNSMNKLSRISYKYGDYNIGRKNGLKAIRFSKSISNMDLMADASLNVCLNYEYLGKRELAKIYCDKAIKINNIIGKTIVRPEYYMNNGYIYSFVSVVRDYKKSLENYNAALAISKARGLLLFDINALSGISENYSVMSDYDNAIEELNKAMQIEKKLNINYKSCNDCTLGFIYWGKKEYNKAILYYNNAVVNGIKSGNNLLLSSVASHLASIYFELGKYSEALKYSTMALEANKQIYRYDHHYNEYQKSWQQKIINKMEKR